MLAPWIIDNLPPHRIYVEPFGGGGSVLMRKRRSYAEVYNDKWDVVVNVFRVLRDQEKALRLRQLLHLTPFSRTEFEACRDSEIRELRDDIERARRTILRSFCGFGSAATNAEYATGFRANSDRLGTTPAQDWKNFPDHIEGFTDRLRGVIIENRDAAEIIEKHDSPETLFYVDPPYVHCTRNMQRGNAAYAEEMNDEGHRALALQLQSVKGMVVLSGYPSELYSELYGNWLRLDREANADGARKRTECLWMNLASQARRRCPTLYEIMA